MACGIRYPVVHVLSRLRKWYLIGGRTNAACSDKVGRFFSRNQGKSKLLLLERVGLYWCYGTGYCKARSDHDIDRQLNDRAPVFNVTY